MEIFRTDGHLTEQALTALARNVPLDPLNRLEAAEHLSFCDLCLQRYTDLLAEAPLLTPEHSCREKLWRRIWLRTFRVVTSRYATAAAAVALALTMLWSSDFRAVPRYQVPESRPVIAEHLRSWPERCNNTLNQAMSGLGDFFGSLRLGDF